MPINQEYLDNQPFNIENPQKVSILWSPDIEWDFANNGYPPHDASQFTWSSTFVPYSVDEAGTLSINHIWMKMKVGTDGTWSIPMRVNYPDVVEGAKGDTGDPGLKGDRGIRGPKGDGVNIQYSDENYNIVSGTSSVIKYVRFKETGGTWTNWMQVIGENGVGSGGTGLPAGGLVGQLLERTAFGHQWIDKTDVYEDADAVAAMGALGNGNPLNHDRYLDAEAVAAMGALDNANPLNHTRYSDAEAIAAVTGGGVLTGTTPIDVTGGVISHDNTNGYKHIPVGGGLNDVMVTDGAGNYTWMTALFNTAIDDTAGTGDTDLLYSADHITALIIGSSFGIKYSWADATARAAQVGMVDYEMGVQQDTRVVYQYLSSAWNVHFTLDAVHDHDTRYELSTDLASSGSSAVHWDNLIGLTSNELKGFWTTTSGLFGGTESIIPGTSTVENLRIREIATYERVADFFARDAAGNTGIDLKDDRNTGAATQRVYQRMTAGNTAQKSQTAWMMFTPFGSHSNKGDTFLTSAGSENDLHFTVQDASRYMDFGIGGTSIDDPSGYSPKMRIDTTGVRLISPPTTAGQYIAELAITTNMLHRVTKQTGYNKAFGKAAGEVAEGNHVHEGMQMALLTSADDLDDYVPGGSGGITEEGITFYRIHGDSLPTHMPSLTLLNSGNDTGQFITGAGFTLKVTVHGKASGGHYWMSHELFGKKGLLASRYYSQFYSGWNYGADPEYGWTSQWSSVTDVKAGTRACSVISPKNLEGLVFRGKLTGADDFDNVTKMGLYTYDGADTPSNYPPGYDNTLNYSVSVIREGSEIKQFARTIRGVGGWSERYSSDGGSSWVSWSTLDTYIASQTGFGGYNTAAFSFLSGSGWTASRAVPASISQGSGLMAGADPEDATRVVGWFKIITSVGGRAQIATLTNSLRPFNTSFLKVRAIESGGSLDLTVYNSVHIDPDGKVYLDLSVGTKYYYIQGTIY
jgi:hypothetical protein